MATGLLVICVGRATKLVEVLTSHQKEYIASMIFGIKTDTKDITGTIIEQRETHMKSDQIKKVINNMPTTYQQEVPIYSAVKINGKKLYEYARKKEVVTLPTREVTIEKLQIIDWQEQEQKLTFLTRVSKGTYIRSLVEDIASHLNTIGTMTELIRTKVGHFTLENANTISEMKNNSYKLYSIYEILHETFETRIITGELEKKVLNGAKIDNPEQLETVFFINEQKEPLALYKKEEDKLKCYKMLKIGIE